jgi:hypothetical protein
MRRGLRFGVALLVLALGTASVSAAPSVTSSPSAGTHGPPDKIMGLDVQKEDIAKVLTQDKRALYVDRVGLYSFREQNKLLQATLEIARFRSSAPWRSGDFQLSIVGHIGSSVPIVVRAGSQPVYVTTSKGLTLAVWFKDGYLVTLAIRRSYAQPKELLRRSLEINP